MSAKHPYSRTERVEQLLQEEISQLLLQQAQDPRFEAVSIMRVHVSKDLSKAKVYFTTHHHQKKRKVTQALNRAAGFFQQALASRITLRKMPVLEFVYDEAEEKSNRVKSLIRQALGRDRS